MTDSTRPTKTTTSDCHVTESSFLAEVMRAEAEAVLQVAASLDPENPKSSDTIRQQWTTAIDLIDQCKGRVVISGMGKSGLIGAKISATFASLGLPSHVLHAAEAVHGDLGRLRRDDLAILLSYSGSTEEVVNLAAILRSDDIPRIGISANSNTKLAKLCSAHLPLGDIIEACPLNLAPTASTTAMLAVGDALALAASRRLNFNEDDFHKHHPGGMLGVGLRPIVDAIRFKVGENLPVIRDDMTVNEALIQARPESQTASLNPVKGRRSGALLLVEASGKLTGIFTDGDLRRLVIDSPAALEGPIRDVMTHAPAHLVVTDLVRDAVQLIRERRLDEIPVLDTDGRPVGLVDVQDLISLKVVNE